MSPHHSCEGARAGTDILIVGAGPGGLYGAYCAGFCGKFRAHAGGVREVDECGVNIVTNAQVETLTGDDRVRQPHLRVDGEDEVRVLEVDAVVAALGFISDLGPLL